MCSGRAPPISTSPPVMAAAARKVAASTRSGTTLWALAVRAPGSTPWMTSRADPMPSTLAPMVLRKWQRSAISGSRAAFSSTVVPRACTAAIRMFSVAPTLGNSRVMSAPKRSSARASR